MDDDYCYENPTNQVTSFCSWDPIREGEHEIAKQEYCQFICYFHPCDECTFEWPDKAKVHYHHDAKSELCRDLEPDEVVKPYHSDHEY